MPFDGPKSWPTLKIYSEQSTDRMRDNFETSHQMLSLQALSNKVSTNIFSILGQQTVTF